jgi:hypothetical protein
MLKMRIGETPVRGGGRHGAGEKHHQIAETCPGARPHGVARPVLDRQITGLEIDEQGFFRRQRFELGGLADAGEANQPDLGAMPFAHPFCRLR